jgi:cytosine/adenosine deaminase-related metal-dependent hydrolase
VLDANPDLASNYVPGSGRFAPGAPADVVVTRYVPPTPLDAGNAWGHLLFGDVESQVRTVFVAGERVLEDGRSTRLDDDELDAACRERAVQVWERFARAPEVRWEVP